MASLKNDLKPEVDYEYYRPCTGWNKESGRKGLKSSTEEIVKESKMIVRTLKREVHYTSNYQRKLDRQPIMGSDDQDKRDKLCADLKALKKTIYTYINSSWQWATILKHAFLKPSMSEDYRSMVVNYEVSCRLFNPSKDFNKNYSFTFDRIKKMYLQNFRPKEIVIEFEYENGIVGSLQILFPVRWHLIHFLMYLNVFADYKLSCKKSVDEILSDGFVRSDPDKFNIDLSAFKTHPGGLAFHLQFDCQEQPKEEHLRNTKMVFSNQYMFAILNYVQAFDDTKVKEPPSDPIGPQ